MKKSKSTTFNIDANIIVTISYLGGLILMWIPTVCYFSWLIPLIIYFTERKNKFIKEESSQAMFIYILTSLLSLIALLLLLLFSPINFKHIYNLLASGTIIILLLITLFVSIIKIIVSYYICISTIKAWNYTQYQIPYITPFLKLFRKYLNKIDKKIYPQNKKEEKTSPTKTKTKKLKGKKIKH